MTCRRGLEAVFLIGACWALTACMALEDGAKMSLGEPDAYSPELSGVRCWHGPSFGGTRQGQTQLVLPATLAPGQGVASFQGQRMRLTSGSVAARPCGSRGGER